MRKFLPRAALVLAILYALFVGLIWGAMRQPPETFGRVMKHMPDVAYFLVPFETMWTHARAGYLQAGDAAPDFSLTKLDKSATVQLSTLTATQPVVLVFGSYTWPPFRREVPALNRLYDQYGQQVAFLIVYIVEAHPSDVWQTASNLKDKIVFASPRDYAERSQVAGSCVRKLGIKFPAVIDGFDNTTESAYTGWPDRIYLIDRNNRVVYKSKPGPFGFKPDDLEKALKKITGSTSAAS
jgi:peroxiredoxin